MLTIALDKLSNLKDMICVVEDEKELCQTIAEGLRIDGFEVDTCYDGEEAWELIWVEHQ